MDIFLFFYNNLFWVYFTGIESNFLQKIFPSVSRKIMDYETVQVPNGKLFIISEFAYVLNSGVKNGKQYLRCQQSGCPAKDKIENGELNL